MSRGAKKGLHVLLHRTQAGPGRTVKQEQEEISRNHVQTFICLSVDSLRYHEIQATFRQNKGEPESRERERVFLILRYRADQVSKIARSKISLKERFRNSLTLRSRTDI